jgi:hypothetical protein
MAVIVPPISDSEIIHALFWKVDVLVPLSSHESQIHSFHPSLTAKIFEAYANVSLACTDYLANTLSRANLRTANSVTSHVFDVIYLVASRVEFNPGAKFVAGYP